MQWPSWGKAVPANRRTLRRQQVASLKEIQSEEEQEGTPLFKRSDDKEERRDRTGTSAQKSYREVVSSLSIPKTGKAKNEITSTKRMEVEKKILPAEPHQQTVEMDLDLLDVGAWEEEMERENAGSTPSEVSMIMDRMSTESNEGAQEKPVEKSQELRRRLGAVRVNKRSSALDLNEAVKAVEEMKAVMKGPQQTRRRYRPSRGITALYVAGLPSNMSKGRLRANLNKLGIVRQTVFSIEYINERIELLIPTERVEDYTKVLKAAQCSVECEWDQLSVGYVDPRPPAVIRGQLEMQHNRVSLLRREMINDQVGRVKTKCIDLLDALHVEFEVKDKYWRDKEKRRVQDLEERHERRMESKTMPKQATGSRGGGQKEQARERVELFNVYQDIREESQDPATTRSGRRDVAGTSREQLRRHRDDTSDGGQHRSTRARRSGQHSDGPDNHSDYHRE
jgi:hypothetical protein